MNLLCEIVVTFILVRCAIRFIVPMTVRKSLSKLGVFLFTELEKRIVERFKSEVSTKDNTDDAKKDGNSDKESSHIRVVK